LRGIIMSRNRFISSGRTSHSFNFSQALVETDRCLGCYEATCIKACPAHVNIPGFIKRFREGNIEGACEMIYDACPMGATCGTACPTPSYCEGSCVLPGMGQQAIRIGALQAFIAQQSQKTETPGVGTKSQKIAVIGGGPGGLGCAVQLARLGYRPYLFEKRDSLGGLVDQVIPFHRLPKEPIEFDLRRIMSSGIEFHLGKEILPQDVAQLEKDFDAIFLGIGLGGVKRSPEFEINTKGIFQALDFLENDRLSKLTDMQPYEIGKRVIVVGGGNVALDAAVVAKRAGADHVIVLYRRSIEEMPGWESEYLEATSLGIEFRWMSIVQEVICEHDKLMGVLIRGMKFDDQEKKGRRQVRIDPGSRPYELACDSLIVAVGQCLETQIPEAFGLDFSNQGTISLPAPDERKGKIFSAGEAVTGSGTIIHSLSQGMAAGKRIHEWLESEQIK
jgi:glutamate synthase (NADPH/NADH) small chain